MNPPSHELFIGKSHSGTPLSLLGAMANRHGLVAGATGTGKTATLQRLAEGFSRLGVPVFTADVKGDLSGVALASAPTGRVAERITQLKLDSYTPRGNPVVFWDVYGERGHHLRTTISDLGPTLLARVLDLNDTQEGVLQIVFKVADEQGLLILDLKDLRALLQWASDNASDLQTSYGNISKASVGAIQRALLTLDEAGGERFFGEPALRIEHLMQRDFSGNGVISVLDATRLLNNPRIYSTFLLWLLSELFEQLPEAGDLPLPKMVFFFDEAHLLFANAPKQLLEKIEQVVRLIRSKGVGVYFVTQNPLDVPDTVLAQLGNRVQHALRAFTERDQKALRAAAQTFRGNPSIDIATVLQELGVGEALVSFLDTRGTPQPVERVLIAPPESRLGALTDQERASIVERSPLRGTYEQVIDRHSAFEMLRDRKSQNDSTPAPVRSADPAPTTATKSNRQGFVEAFVKSTLRAVGSQVGRQIVRGVLGSILAGVSAKAGRR